MQRKGLGGVPAVSQGWRRCFNYNMQCSGMAYSGRGMVDKVRVGSRARLYRFCASDLSLFFPHFISFLVSPRIFSFASSLSAADPLIYVYTLPCRDSLYTLSSLWLWCMYTVRLVKKKGINRFVLTTEIRLRKLLLTLHYWTIWEPRKYVETLFKSLRYFLYVLVHESISWLVTDFSTVQRKLTKN